MLLEWNADLFESIELLADDEQVDVQIPSNSETLTLLRDLAELGRSCGSGSDRHLVTWLLDIRSRETDSNPRAAAAAQVVRLGTCPGIRDLWVALVGVGVDIAETQAVCDQPPT